MPTTAGGSSTVPRLDIRRTLFRAASCLISNWRALIRIATVPVLLALVLEACLRQLSRFILARPESESAATVSLVISIVALPAVWAYFAVAWHRFILLDVSTVERGWHSRHTRFLLAAFGIGLVGAMVAVPVLLLTGAWASDSVLFPWRYALCVLPGCYFTSRLSLALPAIATDRGDRFNAWRTSRANGWRLVVVWYLPSFLVGSLVASVTGPQPSWPLWTMRTVVLAVVAIFALTVISLAFGQLSGAPGPPSTAADGDSP